MASSFFIKGNDFKCIRKVDIQHSSCTESSRKCCKEIIKKKKKNNKNVAQKA